MTTKYKIKVLEKANTLIFDSRRTFDILKKNFNFIDFKDKIIKTIPPPIDTDLFNYSKKLKKIITNYLQLEGLLKEKE
jgi:hypothetical protein